MDDSWEQRVYAAYVTTGGLANSPDPSVLFGPNRPYIEKIIRDHFPIDPSARVLELACGPAPFLYFLKKKGYSNLQGIDVSQEQVDIAHAIGLSKEVIQGDMKELLDQALPGSYDVIVLFDILEHFHRPEQFEILDKVLSRLKNNGICIVHVPNAEGRGGIRILYSDITHKTAFTRRSIEQLLKTIGFQEIRCFEEKPIPHGPISTIRRLLWDVITLFQAFLVGIETGRIGRAGYIFSQNMLVVARKKECEA